MTSDEFIVHSGNRKNKVLSKRLQISNLCEGSAIPESTLKEQLQHLLQAKAGINVTLDHITIQSSSSSASSSCFAVVSLSNDTDLENAIRNLHGIEWQGSALTVEREIPPRRAKETPSKPGQRRSTAPSQFGKKAWAKPKVANSTAATGAVPTAVKNALQLKTVQAPSVDNSVKHSIDADQVQGGDDKIGTLPDEAASLIEQELNTVSQELINPSHVVGESLNDDEHVGSEEPCDEPTSWEDFRARLQKPLSDLLDVYGEADPDWAKQQPPSDITTTATPPDDEDVALQSDDPVVVVPEEVRESRLAVHGKASIHVEVVSFGYLHGVPKEIRNGWCHAQPLPLLDCRDLPQVPPYLSRMDGLCPVIKRVLTKAPTDDDHHHHHRHQKHKSTTTPAPTTKTATTTTKPAALTTKQVAKQLASQIFEALRDAMAAGHGPSSPLQVTIYCGSENGRHRSVVVGELAAIALRKLLRSHPPPMIPYSVSVSTRHRELDRTRRETAHQNSNSRRKQYHNSDD